MSIACQSAYLKVTELELARSRVYQTDAIVNVFDILLCDKCQSMT